MGFSNRLAFQKNRLSLRLENLESREVMNAVDPLTPLVAGPVGDIGAISSSILSPQNQSTANGSVAKFMLFENTEPRSINYVKGGDPVYMMPNVKISTDTPDGKLKNVRVGNPNYRPEDVLICTTIPGIQAIFEHGYLNLTGIATPAQYQDVLRTVQYKNTSSNPTLPPDCFGNNSLSSFEYSGLPEGSDFRTLFYKQMYMSEPIATLEKISDVTINEDAGQNTITLNNITSTLSEPTVLSVTAKSSNPDLIPDPTVTYTHPNSTGTLGFQPVANQYGSATITVTVQDNKGTANGRVDTFSRTFTITVNPVNDRPTLDAIPDLTINEDAGYDTFKLTGINVGPGEKQNYELSITSDNQDLMQDFGLLPNLSTIDSETVEFKPKANAVGEATITVTIKDDGGTANGGVDTFSRTFKIKVNPVNDAPTLDAISDQTINEDSGTTSLDLTGITAGPGETQNLTVSVKSDNPSLIPDPTIDYTNPKTTGKLTFKPVANQFGKATITVTVKDDGGTGVGGVDTFVKTFTINVAPVNDKPSFSGLKDLSVPKNAPAQTETGFVTNLIAGADNETDQKFNFIVVADKPALFSVQPKIDSNGTLTYTTAPNAKGVAKVSVTLQDSGGTVNGGVDKSDTKTFIIDVAPNRAPVIDGGKLRRIGNIAVDSPTPIMVRVKQFGKNGVTDADDDNPLGGIAVTGVDSKDGKWVYAVFNKTYGLYEDFKDLSAASPNNAILLSPDDMVQFWPNANFNGAAKFTYHAWDQTSGKSGEFVDLTVPGATGGATAISTGQATAFVRAAPVIFTQNEDEKTNGRKLDSWKGVSIADADGANAKSGLAIIGSGGNVKGHWEFNLGKGWQTLVGMSPADATLLRRTDSLRFVPDAHQFGDAYLEFVAWDQSTGVAGARVDTADSLGGASPFSADADGFYFRVQAINDRPVLDAGKGFNLTPVKPGDTNPTGDLVSAIIGSAMTDADAGTKPGMAITSRGKIGGNWQYQLASGGGWKDFPTVTDAKALLLGPDDLVRLVPSGTASGATFSFKAWDQSSGKSGQQADSNAGSAFSIAVGKANVSVSVGTVAVNSAPSLSTLSASFTSIREDAKTNGDSVASLLGKSFVDSDAGAFKGIAITGKTGVTDGVWQYSLNGVQWMAVSDVSEARALLLRDTDRLRFVPNSKFNGSVGVSYRAWDQTTGSAGQFANLTLKNATGGSSAFGLQNATASLSVTPVNSRPVLRDTQVDRLRLVTPGDSNPLGDLVADILGGAFSDADANSPKGIGFTLNSKKLGSWQFQLNGSNVWTNVPDLKWGDMLLLRETDRLRFVPAPGFTGQVPLWYRGWDASSGKAGEILSIFSPGNSWSRLLEQRSITVGSANARPVLNIAPNLQLPSVAVGEMAPKGTLVSAILGTSVVDPNRGDAIGIAATGVDNQNGAWQYSLDGMNWLALGSASPTNAVVLKGDSQIRFVPKAGFAGNATISFKAWDQSDKAAPGSRINTAKTNSVSLATQTASLAVNTSPTLTIS